MIRVVTDSNAHLNREVRDQYNIGVVPAVVVFGSKVYRDEVDLTNEQFYEMLRTEKVLPTTSTPAPADFLAIWKPILEAGEEIVSIHIPSTLSATFNSSVNAKAQLETEAGHELPITLVESNYVSMAEGFQALVGAKCALQGGTRLEVAGAMRELDPRLTFVVLLDTLEYLRRGGRIGKAQAFIGGMLQVKPILEVTQGAIEPLERARSHKAGFNRLIDLVGEPPTTAGPRLGTGPLHIAVLHADAHADARFLEAELRARYNIAELFTSNIGPSIGVHSGPKAVGLAFYRE